MFSFLYIHFYTYLINSIGKNAYKAKTSVCFPHNPIKQNRAPVPAPHLRKKLNFLNAIHHSNSSLQSCCVVFFVGFAGRNQGVLSDFYLLRGFLVNCIVILLSQFYFAFQLWLILSYNKHTIYFSKKGIHPCYFNNCIFNSNSSFVDCLVYFIAFFILPALLSSKIFSSKS